MKTNTCKTCIHFKANQRELNYFSDTGFCVNEKFKFNTSIGRLIGVLDKNNLKSVSGNPSHDFEVLTYGSERIHQSRYLLQVSEDFGCIYHQITKSKNNEI